MMTKDELQTKYLDEITGLLMGAFSEAERGSLFSDGGKAEDAAWAAKGRFMRAQMLRARALLGRIHADMEPKVEVKPAEPKLATGTTTKRTA